MTSTKAFVDTNVLLRAFHSTSQGHQKAITLVEKMWDDEIELWISRQVIREYLVQITHPNTFATPLTVEQVSRQIDVIQSLFRVADESRDVTNQLLMLLKTYPTRGKQIHDANIVATMLVYGIDTLLTMNVEDLKRFGDIIKLIPLNTQ